MRCMLDSLAVSISEVLYLYSHISLGFQEYGCLLFIGIVKCMFCIIASASFIRQLLVLWSNAQQSLAYIDPSIRKQSLELAIERSNIPPNPIDKQLKLWAVRAACPKPMNQGSIQIHE